MSQKDAEGPVDGLPDLEQKETGLLAVKWGMVNG